MNTDNWSIKYVQDNKVGNSLNDDIISLLSTCFVEEEDSIFRTQRFYKEIPQHRWLVYDAFGTLIAHTAMHNKQVKTDSRKIPIGGLSEVCVHPKYRKKGLVKLMLHEVELFLKEKRIPISILFGKKQFYMSSGYQIVNNLYSDTIDTKKGWVLIWDPLMKEIVSGTWPIDKVYLSGPIF